MKLFYKEELPEAKKVLEAVKEGYGIPNPQNISGFAGTFLFHIPDVYISNRIAHRMMLAAWMPDFCNDCVARFGRGDWGDITQKENDDNTDTRYLSGVPYWMVARYSKNDLSVVFESMYDISLIYLPGEDVTEICEKQFKKFCRECKIKDRELSDFHKDQI